MTESVFADYEDLNYPHRFNTEIVVATLAGGTPFDPKAIEGWIKTKMGDKDDLIRSELAEIMAEQGMTVEEALEERTKRGMVGFRRDVETGELWFPGRNVKAGLKEATIIAANEGRLPATKWGNPTDATYKKGIKAWFPEHVFVVEDRIPLGVNEPTGVATSFPRSRHGSSIQYTEYVEDAHLSFTVITDHDFGDKEWAAIWLTAENNGIGASRSQGYGTFKVVKWERS